MIGETIGGEQRAPRGPAHTERPPQDGFATTGVPSGPADVAALAAGAALPLQPRPEPRPGRPPGTEPAAVPDTAAAATDATTAASATAAAPAPTTASSTPTDSGSRPSASQHHVRTTWFALSGMTYSGQQGCNTYSTVNALSPQCSHG